MKVHNGVKFKRKVLISILYRSEFLFNWNHIYFTKVAIHSILVISYWNIIIIKIYVVEEAYKMSLLINKLTYKETHLKQLNQFFITGCEML